MFASALFARNAVALFVLGMITALPVAAQGRPGHRGPPPEAGSGQPQWIVRERHEIRRDVLDDGLVVERRRVTQEWQQISPEERQRWMEQRRQMRQMSPEERQRLRRDMLEAYRPPRE